MSKIKKITLISILIIVITSFIFKNNSKQSSSVANSTLDQDIRLKLDVTKYVAIKNGVKQWTLNAEYISLNKEGTKSLIDKPIIKFFTKTGDNFYLSARSGMIDMISNRVSVYGDVYGYNKKCTIRTDKMEYDPENCLLKSNDSVILLDKDIRIKTSKVIINLENTSMRFRHSKK